MCQDNLDTKFTGVIVKKIHLAGSHISDFSTGCTNDTHIYETEHYDCSMVSFLEFAVWNHRPGISHDCVDLNLRNRNWYVSLEFYNW